MRGVSRVASAFASWIAAAAAGLAQPLARITRRRSVELVEQDDGSFAVVKGANRSLVHPLRFDADAFPGSANIRELLARRMVEVSLAPRRFVFRSLELPAGASRFLDGVVRSQIDLLTPWAANEAAFGWSSQIPNERDRITVTVAATSSAQISPIVR